MALLPAFFRPTRMTRRASRPADPQAAGDEAVLDAPDERLSLALVAAGRGEFGAASALLATTRAAAQWEEHDRYTRRREPLTPPPRHEYQSMRP
ncbi:hypothetical protein ACFW7O_32920, partial [Streptomyces diastatochromogenes]